MEFRVLGHKIQEFLVREPIVLSFEAGNGNFRARPTFWWVSCPDWSLEVTENLLQLLISGMLQCIGILFGTFVDIFVHKQRAIVDLGLNFLFPASTNKKKVSRTNKYRKIQLNLILARLL